MRRPIVVALLLALAGAPATARAQQDFVGVRAMGMGEANRATATGAEGPLINPAGMSLVKQYVIEGMYGFRVEDLELDQRRVVEPLLQPLDDALVAIGRGCRFGHAVDAVARKKRQDFGHIACRPRRAEVGDDFQIGLLGSSQIRRAGRRSGCERRGCGHPGSGEKVTASRCRRHLQLLRFSSCLRLSPRHVNPAPRCPLYPT
jgi:hypothetical protein